MIPASPLSSSAVTVAQSSEIDYADLKPRKLNHDERTQRRKLVRAKTFSGKSRALNLMHTLEESDSRARMFVDNASENTRGGVQGEGLQASLLGRNRHSLGNLSVALSGSDLDTFSSDRNAAGSGVGAAVGPIRRLDSPAASNPPILPVQRSQSGSRVTFSSAESSGNA